MSTQKEFTLYSTFIDTAVERIITLFWSKLAIKDTGDSNHDYGNHTSILNFPSSPQQQHEHHPTTKHVQNKMKANNALNTINGETRVSAWLEGLDFIPGTLSETLPNGTGTFGLVRDYCNFPEATMNPPKNHSNEMLKFIEDLRQVVIEQRRELNKRNSAIVRINILKGANTIYHTDTLRSTMMTNYFMFFPPKKNSNWSPLTLDFSLKVRLWPTFKTCFVLFRGEVVIPFAYEECQGNETFIYTKELQKGGFLQLIRQDSSGYSKWLITPLT